MTLLHDWKEDDCWRDDSDDDVEEEEDVFSGMGELKDGGQHDSLPHSQAGFVIKDNGFL